MLEIALKKQIPTEIATAPNAVSMTCSHPRVEVVARPERRRRRPVAEKLEMVAETREPGVTVSLVARRRGVSPNQLFTWRRLAEQGALTATRAEEKVVPASELRASQEQIRQGDSVKI